MEKSKNVDWRIGYVGLARAYAHNIGVRTEYAKRPLEPFFDMTRNICTCVTTCKLQLFQAPNIHNTQTLKDEEKIVEITMDSTESVRAILQAETATRYFAVSEYWTLW